MSLRGSIFVEAFLDGFTGAGLFGRLTRPGAATEYVDARSLEQFKSSFAASNETCDLRTFAKRVDGITSESKSL